MKHIVKIIIILLCVLLFFNSCANSSSDKQEQDGNNSSVEIDEKENLENNTDNLLRDNVPQELDFGGYEYRVLTGEYTTFTNDLYPEGAIGEVLNDALYTRNKKIEERFNITFSSTIINLFELSGTMKRHVLAGENSYDMYMQRIQEIYSMLPLIYPIDDLLYVDITQPYWTQLINKQLSMGGKQYVAVSDEMLSFFEAAVVVYFNKKMGKDLNLDNFYELVRNGTWTQDKFFEFAKQGINDIDGNGELTKEDNWGILSEADYLSVTFWISAGAYMVDKDENDMPYFAVPGRQIFFDIGSKAIEQTNLKGIYIPGSSALLSGYSGNPTDKRLSFFKARHGLFSVGGMDEMKHLRDMDDDFGVIPFPKYTENQPQHYTRICGGFPFVIPTTNQQPEIAGALLEAMACETRNTVIPAYYDSSLKDKHSRDDDTLEMLDLIYNTRVFDLGDTVWFDPIRVGYTRVFDSGKDTFASFTERNMERYKKIIANTFENIVGN